MRTYSDGNNHSFETQRVNLLNNLNYDLLFRLKTVHRTSDIFPNKHISPNHKISPQNVLYDYILYFICYILRVILILFNVKVIFSCSEAGLCSVCLQLIYFLFI